MIYNFRFLSFILIVIIGFTLLSLRVIESNNIEKEINEEQIQNDNNNAVIRQGKVKSLNAIKEDIALEDYISQ